MGDNQLQRAIDAWCTLLSPTNVQLDAQLLNRAGVATFATDARVVAIVRPRTVAETVAAVRIAQEYRIPIHPVSTGKNWGYGSRVPATDQSALIDLSALTHIRSFDERLGIVTLEAGVTFRQLNAFLKVNGDLYALTPPGSTPDASVVANTLERGIVQGHDIERWKNIGNLEVILPNGRLILTDSTSSDMPERPFSLPGPVLAPLFTQSDLGLVTAMTLYLEPKPAVRIPFTFRLPDNAALEPAVDALQFLRHRKILTGECGLFNDFRVMTYIWHNPWQSEPPPLSNLRRTQFQKKLGGMWYGDGTVTAHTVAEAQARQATVKHTLQQISDKFHFIDEIRSQTSTDPTTTGVRSTYWRKPTADGGEDPDLDRCGVVWCPIILPLIGQAVSHQAATVEEILARYRFEASMGILMPTSRHACLTIGIIYDRNAPGDDQSAAACYQELVTRFGDDGYHPYRLGRQGDQWRRSFRHGETEALWQQFKQAVDPAHILK